tara:strand:- start:2300 stop:2593 length:294 start_codon:yes stop_codon:yes gene_type:complete
MSQVQPIPQELWGAMGVIISYLDFANDVSHGLPSKLREATNLLQEYRSCFGADGSVSQRGEMPQCWNPNTIFTPHREVGENEFLTYQPMLPFEKEGE